MHKFPHVIDRPRACSYLPRETAAMEYVFCEGLSPAELEAWIACGWRRFGVQLFRPACAACARCVPLRVDVAAFAPTKSQRRTLRRNEPVRVELHRPEVTPAHIELYNAWHRDMAARSGWPLQQTDATTYAESFLIGDYPSLHELRYYRDGDLAGVGLIEVLPDSLSSVYFYHDPAWRDLGPGTFSVLCELDFAAQLGRRHLYMGYWIAECRSMSYKNRFGPHEVLLHRPRPGEEPRWERVED